jgi:hypothetical protein
MHHQQLPSEVARLFYLPRASISSASHSGSSSRSRELTLNSTNERLRRDAEKISELTVYNGDGGESETEGAAPYHNFNHEEVAGPMHVARQTGMPSLSSSSSSAGSSNHSNYVSRSLMGAAYGALKSPPILSQSVNSLLLSVKNLENFNRANDIERRHRHHRPDSMSSDNNPNIILKSNYYLNYFIHQENATRFPLYEQRWKMLQNIRNIADIHEEKSLPSIGISQGKEADQLSTTSSTTTTNFTGN